jgi:AraC-like DNA-binding protein/mannose-6-phosphate isomerase-like protein (cupin superfamily)
MKNEQEKLIHFDVNSIKGLSVTHGYKIINAFPVHFHTTYNLGIIEQGEREFSYRGEKNIIKRNDIFIIQPFEPHSCKSVNNSEHSYKIISMHLDNSFYFPRLIIHQSNLLSQIKEFHALAEYEKTSVRLRYLYHEIIRLLKTFSIGCNKESLDIGISSNVNKAKEFIENNCHLEISLKDMSEIACLSEFHFNRLFHKQFGLSPYAYYLVSKLKISQNILMEQKSVTGTAFDIGFFDQSHFTRLFKKHVGVTPGKYLRDNRIYEQ